MRYFSTGQCGLGPVCQYRTSQIKLYHDVSTVTRHRRVGHTSQVRDIAQHVLRHYRTFRRRDYASTGNRVGASRGAATRSLPSPKQGLLASEREASASRCERLIASKSRCEEAGSSALEERSWGKIDAVLALALLLRTTPRQARTKESSAGTRHSRVSTEEERNQSRAVAVLIQIVRSWYRLHGERV
eukprot:506505-Rhodomonas_salina.3